MQQQLGPMPSEEEWAEWLIHPCTKRLRFWAEHERMQLMTRWSEGEFSAAFDMEMAVKNAGATGACSVYVNLIDPDYQQIVMEPSDEIKEPERLDTSGAGSAG